MKESEYESLMTLARRHRPDTSAVEFGFETRLMARLRTMAPTAGAEDFAEMFAAWLWRGVFALFPVAAAAAMFFGLSHGFSMSAEAGGIAGHLVGWLPESLF